MLNAQYKNVLKRLVVISISLGFALGVALVGILIASLFGSQEQDIVIDYNKISSVRNAEEQGIFSLGQGDIVILPIAQNQYRIARLLSNNNLSWSVRRLEYSFLVQEQEFLETTTIPAGATQLVVIDVESQTTITTRDVQFRIHTSSWHTEKAPEVKALRAHGSVVTTNTQAGVIRTTVTGTLTNESSEPVHNISVGVLAYNNNAIVGAGSATINTLLAEQSQQVVIYIGSAIYKNITNVVFYTNSSAYSSAV